jgi:hypothetical protein
MNRTYARGLRSSVRKRHCRGKFPFARLRARECASTQTSGCCRPGLTCSRARPSPGSRCSRCLQWGASPRRIRRRSATSRSGSRGASAPGAPGEVVGGDVFPRPDDRDRGAGREGDAGFCAPAEHPQARSIVSLSEQEPRESRDRYSCSYPPPYLGSGRRAAGVRGT